MNTTQQVRPVFHEPREQPFDETADHNGPDRVRRDGVAICSGKAQEISTQRKSHNLPAAVGQQFIKAHHAFEHGVAGGADFLLVEHRLVGTIPQSVAELIELAQFDLIERGADRMRAHRAIGAGLHTGFAANDRSLHAPLQRPPLGPRGYSPQIDAS